ncbi:response regulator transcription factor [Qipengyuania marisflavi]|uniref:response regulator transcription factor n=1 Tax=Qipengyuania marisflavi TaxID=2486356 RepID=UPI003CCC5FDF
MARIIYVEDDELVGQLVMETLADEGHAIGIVGDGKSALQIIATKKPDLVILDVGLPEMGGMEVLAAMRRNQDLYLTPVLMLTGRQSANDEAIAIYTGATEYLRKPFDPDQLVVVVEDLLKPRKGTSAPVLKPV